MEVKLINFNALGDSRGALVALESNKNIPFEIKRVFYIFKTPLNVRRGYHAHKKLQQILICISGSCRIVLDNGRVKKEVVLDSPSEGLLIDEMIWHEMYGFSADCVLISLASDFYDESDYIRNYELFIKTVHNDAFSNGDFK